MDFIRTCGLVVAAIILGAVWLVTWPIGAIHNWAFKRLGFDEI